MPTLPESSELQKSSSFFSLFFSALLKSIDNEFSDIESNNNLVSCHYWNYTTLTNRLKNILPIQKNLRNELFSMDIHYPIVKAKAKHYYPIFRFFRVKKTGVEFRINNDSIKHIRNGSCVYLIRDSYEIDEKNLAMLSNDQIDKIEKYSIILQ